MTGGALQEWEGPAMGGTARTKFASLSSQRRGGMVRADPQGKFQHILGKKSKLRKKIHTYRKHAFLKILRNLQNDYQI